MKFAIIYYSLGGNTRRIANMIKDKISADVEKGIDIRFDESTLRTPISVIEKWIDKCCE